MMEAFTAARKNKLDISVSIAMGSSVQIALFVTPLLVMLSYFIAPEIMDLDFKWGAYIYVAVWNIDSSFNIKPGKVHLAPWRIAYRCLCYLWYYFIFCIN
jgi:Ca2+:H+ antiporter